MMHDGWVQPTRLRAIITSRANTSTSCIVFIALIICNEDLAVWGVYYIVMPNNDVVGRIVSSIENVPWLNSMSH